MTEKQKEAIKIINNLLYHLGGGLISEEEYFILLEFIIDKPMQVWSPTWTPPQPIEPFYKVTCTNEIT